jgi:hypothetical protein
MASAPISSSPSVLSPQSGAPQTLQTRLNALTRRRNSVVLGRHLMRSLVPGVWVSAVGIALYKTHIIPDAPVWAPLAILGVCAAWGLRSGLAGRDGAFRAARDADATLGLKDSLGSALSFVTPDAVGSKRVAPAPKTLGEKAKRAVLGRSETFKAAPHALETTLVPALVADATARAQTLDPRRVYGLKFDRTAKALAIGSILLFGSLFLPDYPIFASKKELAERAAIMKSGEQLAVLSKKIEKRQEPKDAQVAELNKKLQKLGLKMARGRMTKRAALTSIGELKQQLQKAQQQPPRNQNQSSQGGMPQIPEAIKKAPMQSQSGQKVQQDLLNNKYQEAAKELENLADKLEKGQLSQQEKEKAAKDLEEVARQLKQQGGQANENAAKQLEQAAKALRQPEQQNGQQNQQQGQQGQQQQQPGGNQQQPQQGGEKQGQKQQQGQGQQQGQQGQQQQGKQGGQQQQSGQQGQGQQQGGKQGQQQQSGQQGQGPQQGQKGQGQQQGGQGQSPQSQKGGQQSQSQSGQGQQQGGQSQQGSQSGQQGQSPQGQQGQGQQGGQSGAGGQQGGEGQQGQSNASGALRDMANSLRQGAGGSGGNSDLRDMMNNLREAENGSNGGSASGKGNVNLKPGQGGGGEGDSRAIAKIGKDLMASDPHGAVGGGPGLGPRSNAQGSNAGGGVSKVKSNRTGDKRRYEDQWSDGLPRPHSKIDRVKGKWGDSGEVEQLPTRGDGKGGQAHTPYYDVYEARKREAEDAVGRESVPPAYKAPVKDYFESIKP